MIAMSTQVSEIKREGALAAKKQNSVGIDFLRIGPDQFTPMPGGRGVESCPMQDDPETGAVSNAR
jgi:hypothetical protein